MNQRYFKFRNKDGNEIELRGDLTIEDLLRMGFDDIKLVSPDKPLAPHEWRAEGPCTFPEGTTAKDFEPPTRKAPGTSTLRKLEEWLHSMLGFKVIATSAERGKRRLYTTDKANQMVGPIEISSEASIDSLTATLPMLRAMFEEAVAESNSKVDKRTRKRGPYATKKKPKRPGPVKHSTRRKP